MPSYPLYPNFQDRPTRILLLLTLFIYLALGPLPSTHGLSPAPRDSHLAAVALAQLPLAFVPAPGLHSPSGRFLARTPQGDLFFSPTGVNLTLATNPAERAPTAHLRFVGSNPQVTLAPFTRLPGVINRLQGNDPARWQLNLPSYQNLAYHNLYLGIDLHYNGQAGRLKGTYFVAPQADPRQIRWRYAGAHTVQIDQVSGDLHITLATVSGQPGRQLHELAPVAWQEHGGQRTLVPVRYQLHADQSISFALGAYDATQPLTIDPFLVYSTLLGGSAADEGRAIAVDSNGNIYVTGTTLSPDLPSAGAPQATYAGPPSANFGDAFVAKLDPSGQTLIYLTYLGGSGQDIGAALAVDDAGNAYLTGMTESDNFPVLKAYQPNPGAENCSSPPCADGFVAKLNAAGNALLFSTYLGGEREENLGLLDVGTLDSKVGIALDSDKQVYVVGSTDSANFPTANAAFNTLAGLSDIFLSKLSADGQTLLYSTYLGGNGAEGSGGVAVGTAGNAYLTGYTLSGNYPLRNPLQDKNQGIPDLVISQIDTTQSGAASLIYSSYLGGSGSDYSLGIAVDDTGIYLGGHTTSLDFPLQNAYQTSNASAGAPLPREAFAAKLNPVGSALLYSTYLGGADYDVAYGLAVSAAGRIFLTGRTLSDNFPVLDPWQARRRDAHDLFVAQLDPGQSGAPSLVYSSYLGGIDSDYGYGLAVDSTQNIYVTGMTSGIGSESFPIYGKVGPADVNKGVLIAKLSPHSTERIYLPVVRR